MATNAVVLWVLGGTGALLLYSAVKNQHPEKVLLDSLNKNKGNATPAPTPGYAGTSPEFHGVASIPAQGNAPQGYWSGQQDGGAVPAGYSTTTATYIPEST